jgi:hypothetical protein
LGKAAPGSRASTPRGEGIIFAPADAAPFRRSAAKPDEIETEMTLHRVCTLAALAALAAAPAAAQVPVTPRALGMGNAYVAAARGEESLWLNPANLGLPGTSHWSFGIPTLSAGADVLGLGVGDIRDVVQFDEQSDARKQALLDKVPASGTEARGDIRAPLVAAQFRHFALGVSYNTIAGHTLDRDFLDLLFFGFQPQAGRYNITPAETRGFRATYWDFAAAYGRRIPLPSPGPLAVGATVHFYKGSSVIRSGVSAVDTVRNALNIPTDVHVTDSGIQEEGGSGFGVDVGASYQPVQAVTLSASVSNALNSFDWGGDRRLKTVTLTSGDYENGDLQAVLDRFNANEADYVEASANAVQRAMADSLEVGTELPRVLRLGAAFAPRAGTLVSAAYQGNVNTTRVGGVWDKSVGIGVQQRVAFLAARAGLSSNLDSGMLLSGGLSPGPLHLGVAHVTDSQGGADRSGWIATFGLATASRTSMP